MKKLLYLIFFSTLLYSKLEYSKVNSFYFYKGKKSYKISAKKYVKNYSSKNIVSFFFNQERFMLKHNYYKDGNFKVYSSYLNFKKAFKLSKKIYLFEVNGKINNALIKAKKAIYSNKKMILLNCEIKTKKRVLRRKKYIFYL